MASYQQTNTYSQYANYGSGMQYDGTQNKWQQYSANSNQTQLPQNQQQAYQTSQSTDYYSNPDTGGYYGNFAYEQQQNYSTGMIDTNAPTIGQTTGNASINVGNRSTGTTSNIDLAMGGYGIDTGNSFASTTNSIPHGINTNNNSSNDTFGATGTNVRNFGSGATGTFGTNTGGSDSNVLNQMMNMSYGNSGQMSGTNTNNNTLNNAINQTFGNTNNITNNASAANQPNEAYQTASGSGFNAMPGGGKFGAGCNEFNGNDMMTLMQETLMQQMNRGSEFGAGNSWGMPDGSGGYYAPPMGSNFHQGGGPTNEGGRRFRGGRFGSRPERDRGKWIGKDSGHRQEFYGDRFPQMVTGMPGVAGQSHGRGGRVKRAQEGVRINAKGERVVDVEVPLSLYSRWGQLRKIFAKQDTEVVKHLLTFHDELCEECHETESGPGKKRKRKLSTTKEQKGVSGKEEEMEELDEEALAMKQVMGFGSFNTTRGTLDDNSQEKAASVTPGKWNAAFIGPKKPEDSEAKDKPEDDSKEQKNEDGQTLTEDEKLMMKKLGWSVFNKNTENVEDDGDTDNDDKEKGDDGDDQKGTNSEECAQEEKQREITALEGTQE